MARIFVISCCLRDFVADGMYKFMPLKHEVTKGSQITKLVNHPATLFLNHLYSRQLISA